MARSKSGQFRRVVFGELRKSRAALAVSVVCTIGAVAADLLKPWPLKIIVDQLIVKREAVVPFVHGPIPTLLVLCAASVVIALVHAVFSYTQLRITSAVGHRIVHAVRAELFAHLQQLSLRFHHHAGAGDSLSRLSADTSAVNDMYAGTILKIGTEVLTLVGMLGIMAALDWRVALIALATFPFLWHTLSVVYGKTRIAIRKQRKREGEVASRLTEILSSLQVVQAFGREKHEEKTFLAESRGTLASAIRITGMRGSANRRVEVITAIGIAATMIYGGMEVLAGRMLPGELVLFASYLRVMYRPVRNLADISAQVSTAMAAQERISEIFALEPEVHDKEDATEIEAPLRTIEFRNVSFAYGEDTKALDDVSFVIPAGQRLALVGGSGAGKTTILNLLLRLYDVQSGAILANGIDIRDCTRESLRRELGIVLQDACLFGLSVHENIAYGKPDATRDEVIVAATRANAHDFIVAMKDGYDTILGQKGATLSGGQQRRIAIARALIRDPSMLVLDEPMVGLDVESESRVREALDRLTVGKTCLLITHDLESVTSADQILVLEHGRVVAQGNHEALLVRSPRYKQLRDSLQGVATRPET